MPRKKLIKNNIVILLTFLLGIFISFNSVLAESCPALTTVQGTNVNFVGELTDTGGDAINFVWFEYGQTSMYGQKTTEKTLTQEGVYCISVSGFSPCTTYHYRAVAKNSAGTSYGENKTFTTTCGSTTVDIKANGSDGPVTIPYNNSANLTWTSSNADSCYASNAWSGTKAISGSQSTGSLTSSRTYTITCTGSGGSVSDSVNVNVGIQVYADFSFNKTVRNLSNGTIFSESVYADPGEVLIFGIMVKAGSNPLYNVVIKDTLPSGLIYQGDLRIDNVLIAGDILTGLDIGNFSAYQKKTITFRADIGGGENFNFGQTQLTNTALVSSGAISYSDTAKVIVSRAAVAGTATEVTTGLTNNIFFDSFLLPLLITLLIIWLFKSRIFKFEEWLDSRKKEYQIYKSKKILQIKVAKIKAKEFFNQRII